MGDQFRLNAQAQVRSWSSFTLTIHGTAFQNFTTLLQADVDAYIEYERIVGNADGGTPFTPQEYEAFKASVQQARRPENRLYVSYR